MTWLTWLAGPRPDPRTAPRVLSLPCPLCEAEPGEYCDPHTEQAALAVPPCGLCGDPPACPHWCDAAAGFVVLDGDAEAILHTARVLTATGAGLVTREAALAQCAPGREPYSLRKIDQEARAS
jgi:hypothetical protein